MRAQAIDSLAAWPGDLTPPGGVLVLTGYGLDVRVWRGRLRVADGIGRDRRKAIVHRATGRLRRLVVLGHTGSMSFDAIRWLSDVGAGYVQIDEDGRVLAAFGPQGSDRPWLRRAQAAALDAPAGTQIAATLIAAKIAEQKRTLRELERHIPLEPSTWSAIEAAEGRLRVATSRDEIRLAEAVAAAAYWSAWGPLRPTWARREADRVPGPWRTFGSRSSPLTGGPRLAGNPTNAMLNYLYALLEAEASIAARIVGLDPGLGFLHADQPNRDSLSADLMEPIRPMVDRYVLELIAKRTFAMADFHETREGVVRITPALARDLAATAPTWGNAVGRIAEDVARMLEHARHDATPSNRVASVSIRARSVPTPISGRNRSAGRGNMTRDDHPPIPHAGRSCIQCGGPTPPGRITCGDACEQSTRDDGLKAFVAAGTQALRVRHAEGITVAISDTGRASLKELASDRVRQARAWQREHPWPSDLGRFEREILPAIADVPIRDLIEATGLSDAYCRRIKRGQVVPHPMWWDALAELQCGPAR